MPRTLILSGTEGLMSPWTSFWNGRRTFLRIALKFCIANRASFVPLLEKIDQVRSSHGTLTSKVEQHPKMSSASCRVTIDRNADIMRSAWLRIHFVYRGVNRNPKFRNSEVVRIPIQCLDGQQSILSDNFGQAHLHSHLFRNTGKFIVDCLLKKNTCHLKTQYMKH